MRTDNLQETDSKVTDSKVADSRAVGRKEPILVVGPVAEPKEVETVAGHNKEALISRVASDMARKAPRRVANQDLAGEVEDEGQGVEAEEDADHKGAIKVILINIMLEFERRPQTFGFPIIDSIHICFYFVEKDC